jgi:hypothetical protein
MTLETRMDARRIVEEAKMSSHPEHYSGRGATTSDLDNNILEKIYELIRREYGDEASRNYVQMIADIPKLSATNFLLTLYKLEGYGWKWDKKILGKQTGMDVGPDYDDGGREAVGFATIANVIGGISKTDDTDYIRGQFLMRHNVEPKGKGRRDLFGIGYGYDNRRRRG